MLALAVVSVQWFIWGYSLSFGDSGSVFIGNLNHAFFMNLFGPSAYYVTGVTNVPGVAFVVYQGLFYNIYLTYVNDCLMY